MTRSIYRYIILSILSLCLLVQAPIQGEASSTRSPVLYSGIVDGVGSDNNICLAGHRDYNISFIFHDVNSTSLDSLGVRIKVGASSQTLFHWDMVTTGITQEFLVGQMDISGVGFSYDDVNTTFFFKAFFHMDWSYDRQFTLLPTLSMNSTTQDVDAVSELKIIVHGTLEPYGIIVENGKGEQVEEGDQVRSNSTISVSGIKFRYWHLTEYLSVYSPLLPGIDVILTDGMSTWNMTLDERGFASDLQVPDLADDSIHLMMDIPGMPEDWKVKVTQWEFSIGIDGLSPDITLRYPATKETDEEFEWEITVTERPKNKLFVDSSSVMYRVFKNGTWNDWLDVMDVGDDRVIVVRGTAVGVEGKGNTSLQFRASDVLGNENISRVFPVDINQGPRAFVPTIVDGREFFKNQSILISGTDWVVDPDDPLSKMDFEWYIDDDIQPYSTSELFNKTLFTLTSGVHSVRMSVSDGDEEDEVTFSFTVRDVPVNENDNKFIDLVTSTTFLTIAIPLLVAMIIVILVFVIIMLSKKLRRADDFVINEDQTMSASQAEEMARKIRELYEDVAAKHSASENDARIDYDDGKFDFDYNLYEVLGLEPTATDAEVKKKYRQLAAYFHPDRVAHHKEIDPHEAAEEMVRVNKAKEVLLDPVFRADYDAYMGDMEFSMDLNDEAEDWN
ncbi:MAG: J domain-containing protein [Candidatus Thermoplasmatota archaeon]|nr:J domain-containing protein [Candidatus Thermoplasmatota archaeon]